MHTTLAALPIKNPYGIASIPIEGDFKYAKPTLKAKLKTLASTGIIVFFSE